MWKAKLIIVPSTDYPNWLIECTFACTELIGHGKIMNEIAKNKEYKQQRNIQEHEENPKTVTPQDLNRQNARARRKQSLRYQWEYLFYISVCGSWLWSTGT